jgi:hypothetical protein
MRKFIASRDFRAFLGGFMLTTIVLVTANAQRIADDETRYASRLETSAQVWR